MEDFVNIGILGCANIATRSVIPAISELTDLYRIKGIASRSYEKAAGVASRFEIPAFEGYQNLIDIPDLQAVYIPLPNSLHAEWIQKALDKGLHVLVEKSLACEYNDVVRLNNSARQNNLVLVENFQFRFHNQLTFIQDLVKKGIIGELRCMRSSFGFPGLPNKNDIRYQNKLGGGALLDAGAYPLKLAQIFMGKDIEVRAANINFSEGKDVDIWGGAYIKQKNGNMFCELAFGFDQFYQCNIDLWGSIGRIYTNRIFTASKTYEPTIEIETTSGREIITLPADDHFKNMMIHFHSLIKNKNGLEEEYIQNINQSRLINELRIKADE